MKVEVLNQSYVRKNYLSSFASYSCTVIFLRLPAYETLIHRPLGYPVLAARYHVVHEERLILHKNGKPSPF